MDIDNFATCTHNILKPLYYTEDDWGYKSDKVYVPDEMDSYRLRVCTNCGLVFAIPVIDCTN